MKGVRRRKGEERREGKKGEKGGEERREGRILY